MKENANESMIPKFWTRPFWHLSPRIAHSPRRTGNNLEKTTGYACGDLRRESSGRFAESRADIP